MLKEIITQHPLRTIILEFDESKTAPEFEVRALKIYHEAHDRTWAHWERLRIAREKAPILLLGIERAEELYEQTKEKLEHLQIMSPENPERPRITKQLKMYVEELDQYLDAFVPDLIKEANGFYEYHDYSREEEKWWSEVADRQLRDIFKDYEHCSVDIVSLDRDLDDLKGFFGHIRRREGKYYETMNGLIDSYDALNEKIDGLYERIDAHVKGTDV